MGIKLILIIFAVSLLITSQNQIFTMNSPPKSKYVSALTKILRTETYDPIESHKRRQNSFITELSCILDEMPDANEANKDDIKILIDTLNKINDFFLKVEYPIYSELELLLIEKFRTFLTPYIKKDGSENNIASEFLIFKIIVNARTRNKESSMEWRKYQKNPDEKVSTWRDMGRYIIV